MRGNQGFVRGPDFVINPYIAHFWNGDTRYSIFALTTCYIFAIIEAYRKSGRSGSCTFFVPQKRKEGKVEVIEENVPSRKKRRCK